MASWAGGAGAGGASAALEQLVARQLLERKQAEIERATKVQEAQQAQQMAQSAEAQRQSLGLQYANLAANQDEGYQRRSQHVTDTNVAMQRQTLEDQIRAKERGEDVTTHRTDRESDRAFQSSEAEKGRALQRYLLGQRETAEASIHWDKDADGNPRAYRVGKNGDVAPVALPGTAPAGPSKADAFVKDLDAFSQTVYNHPGLSRAGAGLNLGRSYSGDFGNLKAASAQLTNLYLNDPDVRAKIAAMKPATDADVKRALSQAVNLDVENMDAATIKAEIDRMRTKAGLKALGTAPLDNGPSRAGALPPMTKEQKNTRTGQTRMLTSTDGGQSWH